MIKFIFFLIFSLTSNNALSVCGDFDIEKYIMKTQDIDTISFKDCTDEGRATSSKEKTCKCATKNLEKYGLSSSILDQGEKEQILAKKKKFQDQLLDEVQKSLMDLSEQVFAANAIMPNEELNCNLNEAMNPSIQSLNSVFICDDENTFIDADKRKKLSSDYYNATITQIKDRKNNEGYYSSKKNNSCSEVSDDMIAGIYSTLTAPNLIQSIQKNYKSELNTNSAKDFKDFLRNNQINTASKEETIGYAQYMNSESIFQAMKTGTLGSPLSETPGFKQEQIANFNAKCDTIKTSLKTALCMGPDDNAFPVNHRKMQSGLRETLPKEGDSESLKTPATQAMLNNITIAEGYCQEESSENNLYNEARDKSIALQPSLIKGKNYEDAKNDYYSTTYQLPNEKLCKYLPPKNADALAKKLKECADESKLMDYECSLVVGMNEYLNQQKYKLASEEYGEEIAANVVSLGLSEEDTTKEIHKQIKEKANKISDAKVIAEKEKQEEGERDSKLINSFFGNTEPETQVASTESSESTSSASLASGSKTAKASSAVSAQVASAQKSFSEYTEKAQAKESNDSQKRKNEFFDEVAKRITRRKKQASVDDSIAGTNTASQVSREAIESISPPSYPESRLDDSMDSVSYYDDSDNFNDNGSNHVPTRMFSPNIPEAKEYIPEKTFASSSYNKALAEANKNMKRIAAEKAAKKANTGKIPDPPFGFAGNDNIGRGIASVGGTSFGGTNQFGAQKISIDPSSLEKNLESLIGQALQEKENGIDGANIKEAQVLLEIFDENNKKAVTIAAADNPEFEVQILKKKNGELELKALGNMANGEYKSFVKKINDFIIKYGDVDYQANFQTMLKRLSAVINKGVDPSPPDTGRVSISDFYK